MVKTRWTGLNDQDYQPLRKDYEEADDDNDGDDDEEEANEYNPF